MSRRPSPPRRSRRHRRLLSNRSQSKNAHLAPGSTRPRGRPSKKRLRKGRKLPTAQPRSPSNLTLLLPFRCRNRPQQPTPRKAQHRRKAPRLPKPHNRRKARHPYPIRSAAFRNLGRCGRLSAEAAPYIHPWRSPPGSRLPALSTEPFPSRRVLCRAVRRVLVQQPRYPPRVRGSRFLPNPYVRLRPLRRGICVPKPAMHRPLQPNQHRSRRPTSCFPVLRRQLPALPCPAFPEHPSRPGPRLHGRRSRPVRRLRRDPPARAPA